MNTDADYDGNEEEGGGGVELKFCVCNNNSIHDKIKLVSHADESLNTEKFVFSSVCVCVCVCV